MSFKDLSSYLQKLESTTSRNLMIEILADLFSRANGQEIDKMIYLLQGRVVPLYVHTEFGMADKMVIRAIAVANKMEDKEVTAFFKKIGDLGGVAEYIAQKKKGNGSGLTVEEVYDVLKKVAQTGGAGSVDIKINLIAGLLNRLDSLSCRYVARIPVGRLRLGFSDMTVLDSFSWMLSKSKVHRTEIERAFNVHPDLGLIGSIVKEKGVAGLKKVKPEVFAPIRMARAERLSSAKEIIEKIGTCAIEPKIDGFRLQAHYKKNIKYHPSADGSKIKDSVRLFTRNLEEVAFMYPDIVAGIEKQVEVNEVVFEGEAIAYHPESGEYLPFQETVQRKRKYGIEEKAKTIPLKLICFDLLYKDGKNFIELPYETRRKELERTIKKGDVLIVSEEHIAKDEKTIELEFDTAVSRGLEGIMAKRLDGAYQAGARGWNWIKYKRSYSSSLEDTIDALVMGYNAGQGKRTAFGMGAFLIGIYDAQRDLFATVAKIGTGLTDVEWRELHKRCNKLRSSEKPPLYDVDKLLEPDVWVEPEIVVEIRADEITRSPIHTAGRVLKPSKSGSAFEVDIPGFALRFPRLERFRDDKKPDDATTLSEIEKMFADQKKQNVITKG